MQKDKPVDALAGELYTALTQRKPIELISERCPDLTIEDAYAVSLSVLNQRLANGERLIGKKIGLTAKPVQDLLGINEPDFGFLTDAMQIENNGAVNVAETMLTPMLEAEIAFVLKKSLPKSGVTPEQVLDATDYVTGCFEIVDTRFNTQKIKIVDTIADNASSAFFVLGDARVDPKSLDLPNVVCKVMRNGDEILIGKGEAVMGSPLNSLAWLANRLGAFGVSLDAGDIVLPGSVVPFAPIAAGDVFAADFSGIGAVKMRFE